MSRDTAKEQAVEAAFEKYITGPTHQILEFDAQADKYKNYDGLSPMKRTELFCQMLHGELAKYETCPAINASLTDNSVRAIQQLWYARQIADSHGHEYAEFIRRLVPYTAGSVRRRIFASDISRCGAALADMLLLHRWGE